MKIKSNVLMIIAMCGMLMGCTNKGGNVVSGSKYEALNGRKAKPVYETLTTSSIASLNYFKTSAAADARNFANFIDGLLTHNDFGTLELDLAESARHNEDYTEFKFVVREDPNLVWVNYEGNPYKVNGEVQYVKAEDFVAGAKVVCDYSTDSNTFYLMRDFIKGALEYWLYTRIKTELENETPDFAYLKDDNAAQADWIQKQIKKNYKNVYQDGGYEDNPIEAEHIPLIASGQRLGVTADPATRTVTYTLMQPAMYFPTLLTYSCYLPVNETFYKEKGASGFGTARRDSILYNGPFILTQLDETNIVFSKNETYAQRKDLHDYNSVHVEKVKYNIVKSDIDETYTRTQFENGKIDGFSLSPSDTEGWDKYVTGSDASNPGTIEEPASGLVNSRLLDTIGYAYGSNLVLERSKHAKGYRTFSSQGSTKQIKNTERALRLEDVRKAIMASFDYPTYYKRYADGDSSSILASQEMVSTYVPKNFVFDNNGNEYTQTYYAQALADHDGITLEQAQQKISVGTWQYRHIDNQEQINALVQKAKDAITAYNASPLAASNAYGKITYPIYIEYFSAWASQLTKTYDVQMIASMNKRLNNVTSVADDLSNLETFVVIPTDQYSSTNEDEISGKSTGAAAYDFSPVLWGWGADYGDPLTYMNTYTKGGDWSSIFPYIAYDYVPNIKVNGSDVTEEDLLAHYTATVKAGQVENENLTQRYTKFAQAEVELINDLAIYMPQTNDGQGWSLTISKAAGYECPTANYGLSNDRLTGLWVLEEPLTRDERKAIREEQEAAKKAWNDTHPSYNIYG